MDVSCHSFIRMAKLALPLMTEGGSLMTMTFYGADRAVDHYNVMGPVKAALESSVRYLAVDLAARRVHVHAISAGAVKTRAASGIDHFDALLDDVRSHTPAQHLVTIEEIGRIAAVLASDAGMTLTGLSHLRGCGLSCDGVTMMDEFATAPFQDLGSHLLFDTSDHRSVILRLHEDIGDRKARSREVLDCAIAGRVKRRHAVQPIRGYSRNAHIYPAAVVELECR